GWLDATGDVGVVRAHVEGWLGQHGTALEAQFVYRSWLDATGDVGVVRAHIEEWLGLNGAELDASFVYRSWLESGQPLSSIKASCEAWLWEHWRSDDAVYVTKSLSTASELSLDGIACIVAWAGVHAKDEDAIFRLSRVSGLLMKHPLDTRFRKLLELATDAVFSDLMLRTKLGNNERNALAILFGSFARPNLAREEHWEQTLERFCTALRRGSVLQNFNEFSGGAWALLLHDSQLRNLLDPAGDAAAIRHAHDLIREAMQAEDYADLLSTGYLPAPPASSAP
ncbi:MAG: hypothetical protein AAGJ28_00425, partial [Pseudomonadota bacterium]